MALPRGALFRHRRRSGSYGSYSTWKVLRALGVLNKTPSDNTPRWTSKSVSQAIGACQDRTVRMLGRLRKRGLVAWTRDLRGRWAWVITTEGRTYLEKEVARKVKFEMRKKDYLSDKLIEIIERAIVAFTKLKKYGWRDVQARECLINFNIDRIEWALEMAERKIVVKHGAYVRSLIENGHQHERRVRTYIYKSANSLKKHVCDEVVHEAMRTEKPFRSAVYLVAALKAMGKELRDVTPRDVGDACFKLYKAGSLKISKKHNVWFVA